MIMKYPIKIYFLSRPRRFGKSLLVSTLENYYLGRKELFRGLAMEQLEKEWNVHPVFHIDFNGSDFTEEGVLKQKLNGYVADWEKVYELEEYARTLDLGSRFQKVLEAAHKLSGRRAVVLVDEYDKPILDVLSGCAGPGRETGGTAPRHAESLLLGVQGSGQTSPVRTADGSDQVLAGERVQRIQPAGRHQHGLPV